MTPNEMVCRRFSVRRVARRVGHATVLVFCAWWLIATSATPAPRDCFTGLGTQARIQVVVGPTDGGAPSCAGIDGLLPGANVTLTLSKAPRPPCGSADCYGYNTTSVEGLVGVTVVGEGNGVTACNAFAYVELLAAKFVGATTPPGCPGSWEMTLVPMVAPVDGATISPFDAGAAQPWIMWRRIGIDTDPSACGDGGGGVKYCEDQFTVQSITNVTP
jgi:hypothetical protein